VQHRLCTIRASGAPTNPEQLGKRYSRQARITTSRPPAAQWETVQAHSACPAQQRRSQASMLASLRTRTDHAGGFHDATKPSGRWCPVNEPSQVLLCQCGHERQAHRHYRRGSECGLCECPGWSPPSRFRRLLRRSRGGGDQDSRYDVTSTACSYHMASGSNLAQLPQLGFDGHDVVQ
jgi:hypothetical protein